MLIKVWNLKLKSPSVAQLERLVTNYADKLMPLLYCHFERKRLPELNCNQSSPITHTQSRPTTYLFAGARSTEEVEGHVCRNTDERGESHAVPKYCSPWRIEILKEFELWGN